MVTCYCTSTAVAMGTVPVAGVIGVAEAKEVSSAAVAVGIGSIEEMGVRQIGHVCVRVAQARHIAMCPHGRRHVSTYVLKHTTHSLLLVATAVPMGMAMAETGWVNTEPISVAVAIGTAVATGGGSDSGLCGYQKEDHSRAAVSP